MLHCQTTNHTLICRSQLDSQQLWSVSADPAVSFPSLSCAFQSFSALQQAFPLLGPTDKVNKLTMLKFRKMNRGWGLFYTLIQTFEQLWFQDGSFKWSKFNPALAYHNKKTASKATLRVETRPIDSIFCTQNSQKHDNFLSLILQKWHAWSLAPVVHKPDNFIHWISHHPPQQRYSVSCFWWDLSTGQLFNTSYTFTFLRFKIHMAISSFSCIFHLLDKSLSSG